MTVENSKIKENEIALVEDLLSKLAVIEKVDEVSQVDKKLVMETREKELEILELLEFSIDFAKRSKTVSDINSRMGCVLEAVAQHIIKKDKLKGNCFILFIRSIFSYASFFDLEKPKNISEENWLVKKHAALVTFAAEGYSEEHLLKIEEYAKTVDWKPLNDFMVNKWTLAWKD